MDIGDTVEFRGRVGTVVGFQPKGMVDVEFDGSVERRRSEDLAVKARMNGAPVLPWWGWGIVGLGVAIARFRRPR